MAIAPDGDHLYLSYTDSSGDSIVDQYELTGSAITGGPHDGVFIDFAGTLSPQGTGAAQLSIPNVPSLSGLSFLVSGVSIATTPSPWVTGIAGAHRFVLP